MSMPRTKLELFERHLYNMFDFIYLHSGVNGKQCIPDVSTAIMFIQQTKNTSIDELKQNFAQYLGAIQNLNGEQLAKLERYLSALRELVD